MNDSIKGVILRPISPSLRPGLYSISEQTLVYLIMFYSMWKKDIQGKQDIWIRLSENGQINA